MNTVHELVRTEVTCDNSGILEKPVENKTIKKFPAFYETHKVHYRAPKSPPRVPVPRQENLIHTHKYCFPKIHFNIVFPSTPRSFVQSLSSSQNLVHISHVPTHATCFAHLILVEFINLVISDKV